MAAVAALMIGGCGNVSSPPNASSTSGNPEQTPNAASLTQGTDANFEHEVLKADSPVLVDFWAPWCGPCRAVAPTVEEISREYAGRLKVVKLNVDENPKTTEVYQIRSIPSLYLYKNGVVVEQLVGAIPKATLANIINKHL